MAWVRLDDRFAFHAKILALPDEAFRLHVSALCWSNAEGMDGRIARGVARRLPGGTVRAIKSLLDARVWKAADGGYVIHDYLNYQRSRAEVDAQQSQRSKAGHRGALKTNAQQAAKGPAKVSANEPPQGAAAKGAANQPPQYPVPSTDPPIVPQRGTRTRLTPKLQAEAEHIRRSQEVKRLVQTEGLTFVEASRRVGFT